MKEGFVIVNEDKNKLRMRSSEISSFMKILRDEEFEDYVRQKYKMNYNVRWDVGVYSIV